MFNFLLELGMRNSERPRISWRIARVLRFIYSFELGFSNNLKIGNNVRFVHYGLGCVVHQDTIIGNNCKIYQNVTIGGNSKFMGEKNTNPGVPVIGDNVIIYSGAVLVGPIIIGNNSVIGANEVITKDVPPNSIVKHNIIRKIQKDKKYSN